MLENVVPLRLLYGLFGIRLDGVYSGKFSCILLQPSGVFVSLFSVVEATWGCVSVSLFSVVEATWGCVSVSLFSVVEATWGCVSVSLFSVVEATPWDASRAVADVSSGWDEGSIFSLVSTAFALVTDG